MPREWKAKVETSKRVKLPAPAAGAAAKATPMQGWYRRGGWKGRPKQAGGDGDEMGPIATRKSCRASSIDHCAFGGEVTPRASNFRIWELGYSGHIRLIRQTND